MQSKLSDMLKNVESDNNPPINVDPDNKLPPEVRKKVEEKFKSGSFETESTTADQKIKEWVNNLSRKEKFKHGLMSEGYKAGYTKPTIDQKKSKNRKKNKQSKQSRKRNRK